MIHHGDTEARRSNIIVMRMLFVLLIAGSLAFVQEQKPQIPPAQAPAQPAAPATTPGNIIPEISADMGECTVDFVITDLAGKGIYNAKVSTIIRHGFLNKRKLELEAATNSDGRLRYVALPNSVKDPLTFRIRYGGDSQRITWDPGNNCKARYDVPLKTGAAPKKD